MRSRQTAARFRWFVLVRRMRELARGVGLCMYFCLSSVLIGSSAVAFYKLAQPILNPDPDRSAALPLVQPDIDRPAEISSATERPAGDEAAFPSAIQGAAKASSAPDADRSKKPGAERLSSDTTRKRSARVKRHDPMLDYAAQPGFRDYRQWNGYQAWSGYRSFGRYQAWGGYGPWNGYQARDGRNGH